MSYELDENYFMSRKLVEFRTAVIGELEAASIVGAADAAPGGVIQTRDAPLVRGINECPVCSKGFSSTSTLNRHWRDFHTVHDRSKGTANVVFTDDSTRMLRYDVNGLSVCDSTAACSVSATDQGSQTSGQLCNRQCSVCLKTFSSTSTLNRHRRDFHGDQHRFRSPDQGSEAKANDAEAMSVCHSATCNGGGEGGGMEQFCSFCDRQCAICLKTFSSSSTLNRHRREIHGDHSEKKGSAARCSECHRTLCNRAAFIRHLAVSHPEIAVEREELMFNSESAFDAWKTKMEADTESTFIKQDGAKRGKDGIVIHYYTCHQSGGCVSANQKSRKSGFGLRTTAGSVKCSVGFFCPAHIVARTCANRWVSVVHVSTHVGHQHVHHHGRHHNNNGHHQHQHHKLKHPADHEQSTPDDQFRTRKEHLSELLKELLPVVDECNTEKELDAFDGILKLVRPVLATIRSSDDQDGQLPFAKQVLDVLCPLGLGRTWRPIQMLKTEKGSGEVGVDDEDDNAHQNSTTSGFLE